MLYRWLADAVVVIHCLIGVFFLGGAFLAWKYPWVALLHIPLAIWVCSSLFTGWTCPLTPLESFLRRTAGLQGYETSFVDHYFGRYIAPVSEADPAEYKLGRKAEVTLGITLALWTIAAHGPNFGEYYRAVRMNVQTAPAGTTSFPQPDEFGTRVKGPCPFPPEATTLTSRC